VASGSGRLAPAAKRSCGSQERLPVDAERLAGLLALVEDETLSESGAKDVLALMLEDARPAPDIVAQRDLRQIRGDSELAELIDHILDQNREQARAYLDGKQALLTWFMGQLMRATGGRADPHRAEELLRSALEERR